MSKLVVKKVEKSYKYEGYVFVIAGYEGKVKEYTYKRKLYPNWKRGRHAFVLDNAIYSFVWNDLVKEIGTDIRFEKLIKGNKEEEKEVSESQEVETVTDAVEKTIENTEPVKLEVPAGPVKHEKYELIKKCLEKNRNIYLAGPAGSGKNFTVEQIAKDMGWEFYYTNSVQQEYKLTGFIDAGGEYHETEFFKACNSDKECVFFLDEMDASIPEVLVLLNSAIANGYFEFPIGRVDFDKVHFVAAGNTVGSGADEKYTGRMVLDQATLDRFIIIEFDYCLGVELKLANGNVDLVNFIRQLRREADEKGIRATFSYRCITDVTELEDVLDVVEIIKIAVVKGMDKDTINTLQPSGFTKYHEALRKLQRAA